MHSPRTPRPRCGSRSQRSSALARQIENGARADVFFSADLEWMDYLQARNLIQPATRRDLLGNQLVLIAPLDGKIKLKIAPHFALAAALGRGRLATGDPDSVPAGRYAHEALAHLDVWEQVAPRLVRADSVRAALAFVDRGEAALGIVYATDAMIDKNVRVIDVFPADTPYADHLSGCAGNGRRCPCGQVPSLYSRSRRGFDLSPLRIHAAALGGLRASPRDPGRVCLCGCRRKMTRCDPTDGRDR